jgi:hypothetical protein
LRNKLFRAGAILAAAIEGFQKRLERIFLSKSANERCAARRALKLQRTTSEAERLDRLRNPSRYQGR